MRLADRALVDPFHGREDLERGVLRTVSPRSFSEDPLRLVRALRFVSQLGLEPDEETLREMHEEAASVRLVSGERIGGGLAADGMGELSKLLLGRRAAQGARASRATRACSSRCCPSSSRAVGFDQESRYHDLTVDEHTFAVVQAAADAGMPLRVRLAALFHDLGKPHVAWRGRDGRLHFYARPGQPRPRRGRRRARRRGAAAAALPDRPARARRPHRPLPHVQRRHGPTRCTRGGMLARYGEGLALDLLDHKEADLLGKGREGPRDVQRARAPAPLPRGRRAASGRARTASPT